MLACTREAPMRDYEGAECNFRQVSWNAGFSERCVCVGGRLRSVVNLAGHYTDNKAFKVIRIQQQQQKKTLIYH